MDIQAGLDIVVCLDLLAFQVTQVGVGSQDGLDKMQYLQYIISRMQIQIYLDIRN